MDNREAQVLAVIPARYASTRFPGKPLADICGKPMVEHVYRRAQESEAVSRVVVATDDQRIKEVVEAFGGEAVMTSPDHATGTDRIVEAVKMFGEVDIVVNVQGDEPLLDPQMISSVVRPLVDDSNLAMGTASVPLQDMAEYADPNVVKVVCDHAGHALYFSRAPIPFVRAAGGGFQKIKESCRKHVGLYAYRRDFLEAFPALKRPAMEVIESLEQLRALGNGYRIKVVPVAAQNFGVDTPEDLEKVRKVLSEKED